MLVEYTKPDLEMKGLKAKELYLKRKEKATENAKDNFSQSNYEDQQDALRALWTTQNTINGAIRPENTVVQEERNRIRREHYRRWNDYGKEFFQNVDIHHVWIAGTAEYTRVAFVERDAHKRGVIKVVSVLRGELP
jgi:hypothetical protein